MIAAPTKRTFYKIHSHTISLPGQTLAAISANESSPGPLAIFIHGITASANLWLRRCLPEFGTDVSGFR